MINLATNDVVKFISEEKFTLNKSECFNCYREITEDERYYTDCFDGFGSVEYCGDCIVEGAKAGFNNLKTICTCGEKMTVLYNDETIKRIVKSDGIIFYVCENFLKCTNENIGVGLYVHQRSEVIDKVFNDEVHPDELEEEYVYDLMYAATYQRDNPYLFDKPYDPEWRKLMRVK